MHEEKHADRDDYVLVEIDDLPPRQRACQFCFKGQPDAHAVAQGQRERTGSAPALTAPPPPPAASSGVRSGQAALAVDLATGQLSEWRIDSSRRDARLPGSISPQSPVGRALVGRHIGDIVTVELPRGRRRLKIDEIRAPDE